MKILTLNDFQKKSLIAKYKEITLLKIEDKESKYGFVSFIEINIQDRTREVVSHTWDYEKSNVVVKSMYMLNTEIDYTIEFIKHEIESELRLR